MRPTLFAVAALTAVACSSNTSSKSDTTTPAPAVATSPDPAVVRTAIDSANSRIAAAMIKGDTAGMASLYADDIAMLAPNQKIERGRAEVVKGNAAMGTAFSISAAKFTTQDVIVSGDYAIETGAYDLSLKPKGGKSMHDVGKYITVWKKQPDASYKVVRDIYNTDLPAR